jgi:hypothetical protein
MSDFINLDHIITYNDPLLCKKFNILDEKEKEQLRGIIYQYDLLRIFDLDDFLEDVINEKIQKLYNIMIKNDDILNLCSSLHKTNFNNVSIHKNDLHELNNINEYCESFIILFSYDYLHLFYPCICEFIIHGNINENKHILFQHIFDK